ncbi:MAG: hypothetical protein QXU32_09185 [Nitrososphaerales archaeon]
MKRQNHEEYRRLKREARCLVEHAMLLVKNWAYYDSSHDMNFLDAVVKVLGSKRDYDEFSSYRERI